jgi:hypothetical protein
MLAMHVGMFLRTFSLRSHFNDVLPESAPVLGAPLSRRMGIKWHSYGLLCQLSAWVWRWPSPMFG